MFAAQLSPLLAVPNVTAHPSTASVQITVLLYDGPLLCGFNVAIKGLSELCWLMVCKYMFPAIFWDSVVIFIESSVPRSWSWTVQHVLKAATLSVIVYRLVIVTHGVFYWYLLLVLVHYWYLLLVSRMRVCWLIVIKLSNDWFLTTVVCSEVYDLQ